MAATLSIESVNHALISVPVPYTYENADWRIQQQLNGLCDLPLCCLRAEDPETGPLIGAVSLVPHDSDRPSVLRRTTVSSSEGRDVDLGYYLHPDWRGKCIVQASVPAIVSWGREYEGVGTVVVRVLEENLASRKIIAGIEEFKRVNGEDEFVEWPEAKGGGRKRLFVFEWTV
jgi:RimJ/RimL family protein N-acetyltransferase